MGAVRVKFSNVGRAKKNFFANIQCNCGALDADAMIRAIRKSKALMSRDIDVDDYGNVLVGGFRPVGRWDVIGDAVEEGTP